MTVIVPEAQAIIDRMARHTWTRQRIDRDAIEKAITAHLLELGLPPQPFEWHQTAREGYAAAWSAAESAAWSAAESAAEVNALGAFNHPTQAKLAAIWLPMIDAFDSGLWLYWITPTIVICVEQPSLHISNNRLHREDGPAVEWPTEKYWFWKGVQVTQSVIEHPGKITAKSIIKESNTEVRRVMIERYGYIRYVKDFGGVLVHEDRAGKLWKTGSRPTNGRRFISPEGSAERVDEIAVVEVVNGTREPDGTLKHYFLSVPPDMERATQAVAWTYGLTEKEYTKLRVRT